jgi:hypothetical protein
MGENLRFAGRQKGSLTMAFIMDHCNIGDS